MPGDAVAQQVGVLGGPQGHERRSEAGREGRGGLGDARLGSGDLGGVAGQELVHGLLRGQPGDGRQHPEGVAGQHDDGLGVPSLLARLGVVDEVERVGRPRVLGQLGVVQIQGAVRAQGHIFQDGPEAVGGREDLRLGGFRQMDDLGVAAAFQIEDAAVRPAVLVVADQFAGGVGAQRRLAGAGEPEEHGTVAFRADVGAGVHAQHAPARQQVIHDGEDALLDFPGVLGAADEDQLALEVDDDEHVAVGAIALRIGVEVGELEHREARLEAVSLGALGPDEHGVGEQAVPGGFGDDPHRQPGGRVGARIDVLHKQILVGDVGLHPAQQRIELV